MRTGLEMDFATSETVESDDVDDCRRGARKLGEFNKVGVGTKPFNCCTCVNASKILLHEIRFLRKNNN